MLYSKWLKIYSWQNCDIWHVEKEVQVPVEVLKKPVIHETKPITIKEVDTILTDMDKEEARIKDQIEIEEFLDIEKERLNP